MLTFNLKKEWFEKIKSGVKKTEYRDCKDYWFKRIRKIIENDCGSKSFNICEIMPYAFENPLCCIFRLGYTKTFVKAKIVSVEIVDGLNSDLEHKGSVFAIHFELDEEEEKVKW